MRRTSFKDHAPQLPIVERTGNFITKELSAITDEEIKNFDIETFRSEIKKGNTVTLDLFRHGTKDKESALSEKGAMEARSKGGAQKWGGESLIVSVGSNITDKTGRSMRAAESAHHAGGSYAMDQLMHITLPPAEDLSFLIRGSKKTPFLDTEYPILLTKYTEQVGGDKDLADAEVGKYLYRERYDRIDGVMLAPKDMAARASRQLLKEVIVGLTNDAESKIRFENGSHSWVVDYVVLELCGEKIQNDPINSEATEKDDLITKYGNFVGPTEGLSINVAVNDEGKIKLAVDYRGKHWDVPFEKLVALAKSAPIEK